MLERILAEIALLTTPGDEPVEGRQVMIECRGAEALSCACLQQTFDRGQDVVDIIEAVEM